MSAISSNELLRKVVDSISDHVAVLDSEGYIVFTNKAWNIFAAENCLSADLGWQEVNYLKACEKAARAGDEFGKKAALGIAEVIGGRERFQLEYPCHSPNEKRWFLMNVVAVEHDGSRYLAMSHINITARKLAEETAYKLSLIDGLTGIFNRRHFDRFLADEWRRCARLRLPLTLAMIDIDHFKLLNDTYGHQCGDDCLIKVAQVLARYARRPSDLCARYGGEEFVLVFGNCTLEMVQGELTKLLEEVRSLRLPNPHSPTSGIVTVSIGVTTQYPSSGTIEGVAIEKADAALYRAKQGGRNRIELL